MNVSSVLNEFFAVVLATVRGLVTLIGQAAHGDWVAIFILVWLVVVARIVLAPPRAGRGIRRERAAFRVDSTAPSRRVEPAPPTRLLPTRPHGHPDYCPCKLCRPAREAEAAARVPEPSDRVEAGPCRHELITRVRVVGGEDGQLWRYACANWRCATVWPPDTTWPAGTLFTEEDL